MGQRRVRATGHAWGALVASACGFGLAAAGATIVFDFLDRTRIHSLSDAQPIGVVLGISFSILGATIVARQRANRIGWIFLSVGMLTPLQSLAVLYEERSVIVGGLAGARWAVWANNWLTFPVFPTGFALFAFLLFPNGRLPSRRWRPVAWLAVALTVVGVVSSILQPGNLAPDSSLPPVENPLGVAALGGVANAANTATWIGGAVLLAVVIGGLLARARRASSSQERQQIKLLAYAAAVTISLLLALTALGLAHVAIGNTLWDVPIMFGFGAAVPIACGVAILRYRLYEIDRLISRSISYLLVTGVVAAIFAATVLLTTRVLPFSSPVGVAASTLTAAALFNPLRRRVQQVADRRFNRARYDADATLAAFSGRLRQTVNLESIEQELLGVIRLALAPGHASLWIKPQA